MVAELAAAAALALVCLAEALHLQRCRRVAALAFGPGGRPRFWARPAPLFRAAAAALVAWGLTTLMLIPPKVFKTEIEVSKDPRHVLLVLDVSPSMMLQDAGSDGKLSRKKRVSELLESFFKRLHTGSIVWSVVAVHNGAKPVVVDTRDLEVIRNILNDLPMHHAFDIGKTRLFEGLKEAAEVARPWKLASATLVLISDGDTVPATGMPDLPPSINEVLVVGVGDPRVGKFIDGHMSRQDVSTLRQIAARLKGVYHDGNQKHVDSDTLRKLTAMKIEDPLAEITRREWALAACGLGAALLAFLPLALAMWGTGWRPGVRVERLIRDESRISNHESRVADLHSSSVIPNPQMEDVPHA